MNNEFELAIKDFVRNGGVVLAANDSKSIVGIRGTVEKISETFIKVLVDMSVTIIKKNPEDAALSTKHMLEEIEDEA